MKYVLAFILVIALSKATGGYQKLDLEEFANDETQTFVTKIAEDAARELVGTQYQLASIESVSRQIVAGQNLRYVLKLGLTELQEGYPDSKRVSVLIFSQPWTSTVEVVECFEMDQKLPEINKALLNAIQQNANWENYEIGDEYTKMAQAIIIFLKQHFDIDQSVGFWHYVRSTRGVVGEVPVYKVVVQLTDEQYFKLLVTVDEEGEFVVYSDPLIE